MDLMVLALQTMQLLELRQTEVGGGVVSASSRGRWVGVWLVCPLMGGGWGCG